MKNFWSAVLLILMLVFTSVGGYLVGLFHQVPITDVTDSSLQKTIEDQQTKIISLLDSIDYQNLVFDSLENVKRKNDTIWRVKIADLSKLTITGQYLLLNENMREKCDLISESDWYVLHSDTFKLFDMSEISCINSIFYEHSWFIDQTSLINEQLINQREITAKWEKVSLHKDTIITSQDSALKSKNNQIESLTKSNKKWKNWTKGIGATASGLLILLIVK